MLRQTLQRLDIDVVLLQEVRHPVNDCINVRNYTNQYVRLRQGREGVELLGGVAILTHRRVKAVKLREFEVDNLEAVWADVKVDKVRTVIGSVYIPPGDKHALDLLDTYTCSSNI